MYNIWLYVNAMPYFLSNGLLLSALARPILAHTVYPRLSSSSSSSLSPSWCGDTDGTWRCPLSALSPSCVGDVGLCTELSPDADSSSTRRFGRNPSLAGCQLIFRSHGS